jgi:hypothetical protein
MHEQNQECIYGPIFNLNQSRDKFIEDYAWLCKILRHRARNRNVISIEISRLRDQAWHAITVEK